MRIPLVASRRAAWALLLCTWGALRVDALVRPTAAELLHSASPKPAATRAALGLASLASSTANDGRVVSLQRRAPSAGAAEAQDLLLDTVGADGFNGDTMFSINNSFYQQFQPAVHTSSYTGSFR